MANSVEGRRMLRYDTLKQWARVLLVWKITSTDKSWAVLIRVLGFPSVILPFYCRSTPFREKTLLSKHVFISW